MNPTRTASFSGRARRLVTGILALSAILLILAAGRAFGPNFAAPVYEGHRLDYWMRGHPREYYPAVRAIGTHAVPYLLSELRARDPAWMRGIEGAMARIEMGPPWDTDRVRRYRARLAFQILDLDGLPALFDIVFARPMRLADGDPGYEAAFAMARIGSPAVNEAIRRRLAAAMGDPDPVVRRNACLAVVAGNPCGPDDAVRLATLTRDPDASVRAAAVRATMFATADEEPVLRAIIDRLGDEHAAIRRLAAESIRLRGTRAGPALPALRAAIEAEPSRPRGDTGLDDVDVRCTSPDRMCDAFREAIQAITPAASAP